MVVAVEDAQDVIASQTLSVPFLIGSCKQHEVPLVLDLSCFQLRRDAPIYNASLGLDERARAAREWESFGKSFTPLFEGKSNGVYFPPGTYDALFNARHTLSRLVKNVRGHSRTRRFPGGQEERACSADREQGYLQLFHDAQMAHRVWEKISLAAYKRSIPEVFSQGNAGTYDHFSRMVSRLAPGVLESCGVRRFLWDRLEGMVAGAMALAYHHPLQGSHVATLSPLVPVLFTGVYARAERRSDEALPRVVVSLFEGESHTRSRTFVYPHDEPRFVSYL